MDVDSYLNRIGMQSIQNPTKKFLADLMEHHIQSIPFENFDVIDNISIILEEQRLFTKLVDNNRGGFCFELNGAFAWLLREIGFSVKMTEAAVYSDEKQDFGTLRNHMVLIVDLADGQYLVDVGFGDSHRKPIALPDGEIDDLSGSYRIKYDEQKKLYYLQRLEENGWKPQYYFLLNDLELHDYQENCNWIQNSPESHFTHSRFITKATTHGRISMSEDYITKTKNEEKNKKELKGKNEFFDYLEKKFGIEYDKRILNK